MPQKSDGSDLIAILQGKAMRIMMAGDIPSAIHAFHALTDARSSPCADDWYNLAYLLRCDRQFEAALYHYQRALDLQVADPQEVHVNRAAILSDHLHRPDEAVAALHAALAVDPDYLPALLNLGTLHEDCGRASDARECYERVLKLNPSNGMAHWRLTAIDVHEGKARHAEDRLNETLKTGRVPPSERPDFHFAAGLALDASGRFAEAFSQFVEGNRLAKAQLPKNLIYDQKAMEQQVDRLIAAYPEAPGGAHADPNPDAVTPIFICGLFRSGSTLVERLIGCHPAVTSGGEQEIIPAIVSGIASYPESAAKLDADEIAVLKARYLKEANAIASNGSILTDKRCDNFLHLGFIKQIFPNTKIVHTKRKLIDNMLSIYFLYFADGVSYGFDLEDIKHYAACHDRLMRHWYQLFGADIVTIDYDLLVKDPARIMQNTLWSLDLPWDPSCAATQDDQAAVKTASSWNVRRPLHDRSSGRWHNYAEQLSLIGIDAADV